MYNCVVTNLYTLQSLVEIFDNVLEDTNTQGWLELQTVSAISPIFMNRQVIKVSIHRYYA